MVRYLVRLSYIGTKYRGTQVVHEFPNETIQDVIEKALSQLDLNSFPRTHFASRTDKGVHALSNALHVDLEHKISGEVYQPHHLKKELNTYLMENGHEILVKSAIIVHDEFSARYHAKWRSYHYRLAILKPEIKVLSCHEYLPICEVNRCHIVPSILDTNIVKHVTDMFSGTHNYGTFTKHLKKNPEMKSVRSIEESDFHPLPFSEHLDLQYKNITMWRFYFRSRAFLYHQIRKLVGTALSAGFGRISLKDIQYMLNNPNPENWKKCNLAPACGLYLSHIEYDEKDFWTPRNQNKIPITEDEGSISLCKL